MESSDVSRTIHVDGSGTANVVPDVASATLGVAITGPTVRNVVEQLEEQMNQVIQVLRAQGVTDDTIKTTDFSVRAEYSSQERGHRLTGYRASHLVQISISPPARIGDVLAAAADAGANTIEHITFSSSQPQEVWRQARRLAMGDAFSRAEQLAALAHLELGAAIKIVEQQGYEPVERTYHLAEMAAAPAMKIETGELQFHVQVAVIYDASVRST